MKKCLIGLLVATVLLSGCQNAVTGGGDESKPTITKPKRNVKIFNDNSGKGFKDYEVFVFKYNHSEYEVPADETGYLIESTASRSLAKNKPNERFIKANVFKGYHNVEQLQQKQYEMIKNVASTNNRQMSRTVVGEVEPQNFLDSNKFYITSKLNETNPENIKVLEIDTNANSTDTTKLIKKIQGTNCDVYYTDAINSNYVNNINMCNQLSQNIPGDKKNYFQMIADTFDEIYNQMSNILGNTYLTYSGKNAKSIAIKTSKKVNIIIYDIDNDGSAKDSNNVLTFGMYRPLDIRNNALFEEENKNKKKNDYVWYGNNAKCLYLDSSALLNYTQSLKSTVVHEFAHMITDIQKHAKNTFYGDDNIVSTWYTEMISLVTEDLFSTYLEIDDNSSPISRLYSFPYTYNLGFTSWFDGDAVLYSYANAFAFGAFLTRNFGGLDFYKTLVADTYADKNSVEYAAKMNVTNSNFDFNDIVEKFYFATFMNYDGTTNSESLTLNKSAGFKDDSKFGFKPIDLNDMKWNPVDKDGNIINDDAGNPIEYSCVPLYYPSDKENQLLIEPQGCSIHFIGSDLDSFVYMQQNEAIKNLFILLKNK